MTEKEQIFAYKELRNNGQVFVVNNYEDADRIIEALEKQIPMEHHHTRIDHIVDDVRMSVCPSCLGVIPSHRTEYPNYCISCGQKLKWGNEDDRAD